MTSGSERPLRLGTRGSDLALTQARGIAARLAGHGVESEVVVIRTSGDADQVRPFAEVGAPGLFVRELEAALAEGRVDVAVHCYKDLPSLSPDGLVVAAMPEREDARDRLLVRAEHHDPDAGPIPVRGGARVGTASARRAALLAHLRPDLTATHLRGNVPTRVRRLRDGEHDAVLLAGAGLDRLALAAGRGECAPLDLDGLVLHDLEPTVFVPAPSQGALALQVRADDARAAELARRLDVPDEHELVRAERALLARVEAGCQVPFGAWCRRVGDELELFGALAVDGALRRSARRGRDAEALAREVHAELLPEAAR
jgi:hydroxymethylbilane synthase